MKKYFLSSLTVAMFWLSASSQTIVSIPINQNPIFEVSTNRLDITFPEDASELVLGADIVVKGGSGVYKYQWTDVAGNNLGNEPFLSVAEAGTYLLTIADTCDCEQDVTFYVGTASVGSINVSHLTIYPNPTDGYIRIDGFDPYQIVALDMTGHIVALINNEGMQPIYEADLSHLPSGLYLLNLTDAYHNNVVCRLVKK